MTFKEQMDALKSKVQSKINAESTPEEIQEVIDLLAELDGLSTIHDGVVTENAKFKDTIVNMVLTQGDGKQPKDESNASNTMTIEEAIAEVQNKK